MTAAAPHPDMTIDEAINAAHRAVAEMGIRISPSRVNTLVRRYFHAESAGERRKPLTNPGEEQLIAYLYPRRPRRLVLVDPTGNKAARKVDAERSSLAEHPAAPLNGGNRAACQRARFLTPTAVVPQPHCGRSQMSIPTADSIPARSLAGGAAS